MAIPRLCSSCDIVVLVRTQFCRVSASCRTRSVGLQSIRLFSSSGASFKSSDGSDEFFKPTASFGNAISESGDSVGSETVADVAREMVDISALGLGGFWPSGLIQHSMEMMYNYIHLPWWGSIVAMTVLLRLMIFPLAVKMQRTAAKLAVVNEEAKGLHAVIQQRKMTGDKLGESMAGIEMIKLYQRSSVHPFHMIIFPFAQVPVFLSMLRALYSMAKLPVESMTIGGALWFENLVVPDPYGCLPIFACITFLLNTEMALVSGTENELTRRLQWVFRIGSICVLPVMMAWPSAVTLYWATNSLFSMTQILFFRIHAVKNFFGIPIRKK